MRINATPVTRRVLLALAAGGLAPKRPAVAADTSPLWPRDGLFPDCTQPSACVSSQDDRPQTWDNPWVFDGSVEDSFSALSRTLTSKKMNGKIVASDGERYLRVEYVNRVLICATLALVNATGKDINAPPSTHVLSSPAFQLQV